MLLAPPNPPHPCTPPPSLHQSLRRRCCCRITTMASVSSRFSACAHSSDPAAEQTEPAPLPHRILSHHPPSVCRFCLLTPSSSFPPTPPPLLPGSPSAALLSPLLPSSVGFLSAGRGGGCGGLRWWRGLSHTRLFFSPSLQKTHTLYRRAGVNKAHAAVP